MVYTQKQITALFNKIKYKSYSDLCLSSKIYIKDISMDELEITGYSSPYNGNVYINLNLINKYKLSKNAVIGILAHELGHQVLYRKRSFFKKWLYLRNYFSSIEKRILIEKEADTIAVQRGYGKELIAERESQDIRYANNKERLRLVKKTNLSIKQIKILLKNI